jgi:hypothetical protein
MKVDFDLDNVAVTEFGVGRDDHNGQTFVAVPIDTDVQDVLHAMVAGTWQAMQDSSESGPATYEPSEKHGSVEYRYLPLNDELVSSIRQVHEAANLPLDTNALADPSAVFCYFARLTDETGRHLTGLRRAAQFKGILKKRLVRIVMDSLQLIEDSVFKLDIDFDLLVDTTNVHILHPSGFEFLGKLQEAVVASVQKNFAAIEKDLPFVDFTCLHDYASKHVRAARYLASICSQKETNNISKGALKNLCKATGVVISESKGSIVVQAGHEMAFLEVLDRRRYEVELVQGSPERFKASSRRKLES